MWPYHIMTNSKIFPGRTDAFAVVKIKSFYMIHQNTENLNEVEFIIRLNPFM